MIPAPLPPIPDRSDKYWWHCGYCGARGPGLNEEHAEILLTDHIRERHGPAPQQQPRDTDDEVLRELQGQPAPQQQLCEQCGQPAKWDPDYGWGCDKCEWTSKGPAPEPDCAGCPDKGKCPTRPGEAGCNPGHGYEQGAIDNAQSCDRNPSCPLNDPENRPCQWLGPAPDMWEKAARRWWERSSALHDAVRELYHAAHWTPDRPVDAKALWEKVRDAAGFVKGGAPTPQSQTIEEHDKKVKEYMETCPHPLGKRGIYSVLHCIQCGKILASWGRLV